MLLRKPARGAAMPLVLGVDCLDAPKDPRQVFEHNDALSQRQPIAQTGVLDEQRESRSQITYAAVAEPPAAHLHVAVLGHTKLGAGLPDEVPVRLRRACGDLARNDLPTVFGQGLGPVERDAKLLRSLFGEVDEPGELLVLLPVGLPL